MRLERRTKVKGTPPLGGGRPPFDRRWHPPIKYASQVNAFWYLPKRERKRRGSISMYWFRGGLKRQKSTGGWNVHINGWGCGDGRVRAEVQGFVFVVRKGRRSGGRQALISARTKGSRMGSALKRWTLCMSCGSWRVCKLRGRGRGYEI